MTDKFLQVTFGVNTLMALITLQNTNGNMIEIISWASGKNLGKVNPVGKVLICH